MAKRPVYRALWHGPSSASEKKFSNPVETTMINFRYSLGFDDVTKARNVESLHEAYAEEFSSSHQALGVPKILEISSYSPSVLGKNLSAFHLTFPMKDGRFYPVENIFQTAKVFKGMDKPFNTPELLNGFPSYTKKTIRQLGKGRPLERFELNGVKYPLNPPTFFYDWVYINALNAHPEYHKDIMKYDAFTDIAFNPDKSVNCQAEALALFVSLSKSNLLDKALHDKEFFKNCVDRIHFVDKNLKRGFTMDAADTNNVGSVNKVWRSLYQVFPENLTNPVTTTPISFDYSLLQSIKTLDISSYSHVSLGRDLSAFNLTVPMKDGRSYPVENVFQTAKVFEGMDGPVNDKDPALLNGFPPSTTMAVDKLGKGKFLQRFELDGEVFPLEPPNFFYDWVYVNALNAHPSYHKELMEYDAFTNTAFTPDEANNCQAEAAALFVFLKKSDLLEWALADKERFKFYVENIHSHKLETTHEKVLGRASNTFTKSMNHNMGKNISHMADADAVNRRPNSMDAADTKNVNSKFANSYTRNYSNNYNNSYKKSYSNSYNGYTKSSVKNQQTSNYAEMQRKAYDIKRFVGHLVAQYGLDETNHLLSAVGTVTDAAKDLGMNPFFPGTCDDKMRKSVPLGKLGHVPVDSLLTKDKKLTPEFAKAVKEHDMDKHGNKFITTSQVRFIQAAALYNQLNDVLADKYLKHFENCQAAYNKGSLLAAKAKRDPSLQPQFDAYREEVKKSLNYDCTNYPIKSSFDFNRYSSKFKNDAILKYVKSGKLSFSRIEEWKQDNPKNFDLRVFPLVSNGKYNQMQVGRIAELQSNGFSDETLVTVEPALKKGAIPISAPFLYSKPYGDDKNKRYTSNRRFVFLKDVDLGKLADSKVRVNGLEYNVDSKYRQMVMDRYYRHPSDKSIADMAVSSPVPLKEMHKESLGQFITDSANAGISISPAPTVSMASVDLTVPHPDPKTIPENQKFKYKCMQPILSAERNIKAAIASDVKSKFKDLTPAEQTKKAHEISDVIIAAAKSSYFRACRDTYDMSDQTLSSQAYMNSVLKGSYGLDSGEALDRLCEGHISDRGFSKDQLSAGEWTEENYFDQPRNFLAGRSFNDMVHEINWISSQKDFGIENGSERLRSAMNDLPFTNALDYVSSLSSAYEQAFKYSRDDHDISYGLGIVKEGQDKRLVSDMDRSMMTFKSEIKEKTLDSALCDVQMKYHYNVQTPLMMKEMESARLPLWALDKHDHDLDNLRRFREKNNLEEPMTKNQAYYFSVVQEKVKPAERTMLPDDKLQEVIESFRSSEMDSYKKEIADTMERYNGSGKAVSASMPETKEQEAKEEKKQQEKAAALPKELPKAYSVITQSEYNAIVRTYNSFSEQVSGLTSKRTEALEEGRKENDLKDLDRELYKARKEARRYKQVIDLYKEHKLHVRKEPQHTPAGVGSGKGSRENVPEKSKGRGNPGRQD